MKRFIRSFSLFLLIETFLLFLISFYLYKHVKPIENLLDIISFLLLLFTLISFISAIITSKKQEKIYRYLNKLIFNIKNSKEPEFPKVEDKDLVRIFFGIKEIYRTLKKNAKEIEEEREKLNLIVNSIDDGLLLLDGEKIKIANRAAIRLMNLHDHENKNIIDALSKHMLISIFENILKKGNMEKEVHLENKWFFIKSISLNRNRIVIIRDITREKNYSIMKAKFFEDASHELKTPTASILGYSETLLDNNLDKEIEKKFISYIHDNAKNLAELVEDILTLHRLEKQKEPLKGNCNLDSIAEELILSFESVLTNKGVNFSVECDKKNIKMPCSYIKSILWNLVDNSIKYTDKGFVKVKCSVNDAGLEIIVSDSGVGIEKEHLPYIFDRFYTTQRGRNRKIGGTGLGLSIVKHIVQLYNGKIDVESNPGTGSKFILNIPQQS